jgi:hypothetical protein
MVLLILTFQHCRFVDEKEYTYCAYLMITYGSKEIHKVNLIGY